MLPAHFVEDVRELIALAKECPEPLQEKCLQMLLDDFLKKSGGDAGRQARTISAPQSAPVAEAREEPLVPEGGTIDTPPGQRDLAMTDFHLRAKKFLTQYSISLEDINQLFFMEGNEIKTLYDDLKSTKASETQIRIGLLQALRSGITDGEFQFSGEDVRIECQERKAYDTNNFSNNFKNSASLFAGFEKYDKNSPILKLTDAGKQRLAETIKEMK